MQYITRKRNIGFILFGLAGVNLITLVITLAIFPPLWERLGMPLAARRIGIATVLVTTLTIIVIMVCAGIIVLIKFRKE
ncbi:MAG: hypothetical protein ACFFE5_14410 [Candidatus Thorarchaeota archaeon]